MLSNRWYCFAPVTATFYRECNLYMAKERGRIITKYEIAELSGKSYLKSMIHAGFRKAGMLSFDATEVSNEIILPSQSIPIENMQYRRIKHDNERTIRSKT
ncbi:hypothetical protein DPMN_152156 [Dreissena polymorpha]|uniref:Uncharacterized protein n=1 Tax=Dreissena polymorpha TaxID=45954 RepID=A0A9D4FIE7_DREPO|nr:hypothetical protein DPMN_152156 [Dreissena polymorpha]